MRKILILCCMIPLLFITTSSAFAQNDPPPGIYDALADLSARTGNNFTELGDVFRWHWESVTYNDDIPNCTGLFAGLLSGPTKAALYHLYVDDIHYVYVQPEGQETRYCDAGHV